MIQLNQSYGTHPSLTDLGKDGRVSAEDNLQQFQAQGGLQVQRRREPGGRVAVDQETQVL